MLTPGIGCSAVADIVTRHGPVGHSGELTARGYTAFPQIEHDRLACGNCRKWQGRHGAISRTDSLAIGEMGGMGRNAFEQLSVAIGNAKLLQNRIGANVDEATGYANFFGSGRASDVEHGIG